jgi:2-polyprenyl-6-hydroxyphenyl methylase/3-demethylubiquinone-9 3-methyltransferase
MVNNQLQKNRFHTALDTIQALSKAQKILDIGCQSGHFCGELKKLGHEPYGVEIETQLVDNALTKYKDISFQVCDCEKTIPFNDCYFDTVWAGEVIEHIASTDAFINEINRILKVGGHFVLSTPMHNRLKSTYISLFRFEKHFDPEFPHYRFYTIKSLNEVLTKRGFEIINIKYLGRIPIIANTMLITAKKNKNQTYLSPDLPTRS